MKKTNNPNSVLTHIVRLLGFDGRVAFRRFNEEFEALRHQNRWRLYKDSYLSVVEGYKSYPQLCDYLGEKPGDELYIITLSLVDKLKLELPVCNEKFIGLPLPGCSCSERVAEIYAAVCRHALRKAGFEAEARKQFFALLRDLKTGHVEARPIAAETAENDADIYNSLMTAILTNNETDFDIEIAAHELRSQTRTSRERIKRHMKSLGLKTLKGKKADMHLRASKKTTSVDIEKLAREYPEAYNACVRMRNSREYLQIKLHA